MRENQEKEDNKNKVGFSQRIRFKSIHAVNAMLPAKKIEVRK